MSLTHSKVLIFMGWEMVSVFVKSAEILVPYLLAQDRRAQKIAGSSKALV